MGDRTELPASNGTESKSWDISGHRVSAHELHIQNVPVHVMHQDTEAPVVVPLRKSRSSFRITPPRNVWHYVLPG